MGEVYGNVNVNYSYCKSVAQLKSAADYILGKKREQLAEGIIKTEPELYHAFGCSRDNFANSLLMTRKLHGKKYSRYKEKDILAQKLSISFHPDDNDKVTYADAYKIAEEFAYKFFWSKGYEVLFAVHTDTEHIHVHFIVSNCNLYNGKSFRRGPEELVQMSEFFGKQCQTRGYIHSVRDAYYNPDKNRDVITFGESQMKKRGKLSFKEEIKTYIRLAMNSTGTKTLEDVVQMLKDIYLMDIRLKGNTISYALPYHRNKSGRPQTVRGSRLGSRFTMTGIEKYMQEKEQKKLEYLRMEQDVEKSTPYVEDYGEWQENTEKAEKPEHSSEVSVYEAFDRFQEEQNVPENEEGIFYGSVFRDFNEKWQGKPESGMDEIQKGKQKIPEAQDKVSVMEQPTDYKKLSLKERAKQLPPPSDDMMAEMKEYQKRMGYDADNMKSMRYKMEIYDEFLQEYELRKKYYDSKVGNVQMIKSGNILDKKFSR